MPSQEPPQSVPSVAHAGRVPCGGPLTTVAQVPTLPATSQAWHWPLHAVSQQTESTQLPVWHWFVEVHEFPAASLGTHTFAEHQSPAMQSLSVEQLPRQAVAPQTYGVQLCVCGGGQLPPLQLAASVAVPPEQLAPRHCAVG